jgi:acetyltransferase-like isoleucine patch superfamily enzyme
MRSHLTKLLRGLGRDRREPLSAILRKVVSNAHAIGCAAAWLHGCTAVGARARSFGRPHIDNRGSIVIGDDFAASCTFGTVLLATTRAGHILIGDGVTINYGSAITAASHVRLGNRVMVGPYCVVGDTDAPLVDDQAPRPIEIGDDVWLAGRVMVRPGSRIGAGAVISAGSVVEGEIPARAIVSGAPARVLRIQHPGEMPRRAAAGAMDGGVHVPERRVADANL